VGNCFPGGLLCCLKGTLPFKKLIKMGGELMMQWVNGDQLDELVVVEPWNTGLVTVEIFLSGTA